MKACVIVHIYKDQEEHHDFIDVELDELEAYKKCNAFNQNTDLGIFDVVVKDCKIKI